MLYSKRELKRGYFGCLKLCSQYLNDSVLEMAVRLNGPQRLVELMDNRATAMYGIHFPHHLM